MRSRSYRRAHGVAASCPRRWSWAHPSTRPLQRALHRLLARFPSAPARAPFPPRPGRTPRRALVRRRRAGSSEASLTLGLLAVGVSGWWDCFCTGGRRETRQPGASGNEAKPRWPSATSAAPRLVHAFRCPHEPTAWPFEHGPASRGRHRDPRVEAYARAPPEIEPSTASTRRASAATLGRGAQGRGWRRPSTAPPWLS
jgi:hypothetical protein